MEFNYLVEQFNQLFDHEKRSVLENAEIPFPIIIPKTDNDEQKLKLLQESYSKYSLTELQEKLK